MEELDEKTARIVAWANAQLARADLPKSVQVAPHMEITNLHLFISTNLLRCCEGTGVEKKEARLRLAALERQVCKQ